VTATYNDIPFHRRSCQPSWATSAGTYDKQHTNLWEYCHCPSCRNLSCI